MTILVADVKALRSIGAQLSFAFDGMGYQPENELP
jgi:hypothetical protein